MSVEHDAEMKLARSRALIRKRAPYITKTVYGLVPIPQPGMKTMGVSKDMVLAYDPAWLVGIDDDKIAAALLHEAMHIIRDHLPRMVRLPDKDLANIAGDLCINPELRAAGWILPHGVYPEDYGFPEGLIMEEYYKLLDQRQQQQRQSQKQGGKGGQSQQQTQSQKQQSDGQGDGGQQGGGPKNQQANAQGGKTDGQPPQGRQQGGGAGQKPGQNQQNGQGSGQAQGQGQDPSAGQSGGSSSLPDGRAPGIGCGRCGGCANNPVSPLENQLNQENGRSDVEQRIIVKQTLEDIKHYAAQHGRGSVPGSLLQAIDVQKQRSEVRWQSKFAYWLKKCFGVVESGGMDYSLAQPSKQSYARGFPRPGLVQYQPEVVFILDTSLSMGEQQIKEALIEAVAIMTTLGLENVWLIQADTRVATPPKRVRLRDLLGQVKIHGRGGTNFDHALRVAAKLKPKADMIVYFSDGDGHVSFRPKGIEVVWCIVRNHWNQKPPCDWGHTVIIADESKVKTRMPRTA